MRQLFFALQFRGSVSPLPSGNLQARTTARGQTWRTALEAGGVTGSVDDVGGTAWSFESEVQITGDGTFKEWGTITYGSDLNLRLE